MACLLSNGVQRECDFSVGGLKSSVWLANLEDIESVDQDADGVITGITTVTTGDTFYEFQQEIESASLTQELQTGNISRFVQQTLQLSIASLTQAKIETLNTLALGTVVGIVQDSNGNWLYVGHDGSGLTSNSLSQNTGAAATDDNVSTISLQGSNRGFAPTIDDTILSGIGIS